MAEVQAEGSREVLLNLSGNCIERAAESKREKIRQKADEVEDEELEEKLDMLDDFLENANFNELRRLGFNGEKDMRVRVWRDGESFTVVRAFSFG